MLYLWQTTNHPLFGLCLDLDGTLSVSIPEEVPLLPLLGGKVVVPCYFQDNTVNDPGAPTLAPLSHRIKWTHVTKDKVTLRPEEHTSELQSR